MKKRFKHSFKKINLFSTKGLKSNAQVIVKTKELILLSPKHKENIRRILSKPVKSARGFLSLGLINLQ
jgi:hypothetical protein